MTVVCVLALAVVAGCGEADPSGGSTESSNASVDTVEPMSGGSSSDPSTTATSAAAATQTTVPPASTPPTIAAPGSLLALDVLVFITVENEQGANYDRDLFGYPNDVDGDGCDIRAEVLRRDSLVDTGPDCPVTTGEWHSSYDGTTTTDPDSLELDHVVSLKEAWDSGAWAWDDNRRVAFGNDLADPRTLRSVTSAANQDKGDKDPSNWLPPNEAVVCAYLADVVSIKARWGLTMDESEFGRIRNVLTDRCPEQLIAPWPDAPVVASTTLPPTNPVLAPLPTQAPALIPTVAPAPPPTSPLAPAPAPAPPPPQPFVPQAPSNCDSSYPGVCIPPYPPDLDCGDVSFRRFAVVPPDPHGFDGDNDGVGCES